MNKLYMRVSLMLMSERNYKIVAFLGAKRFESYFSSNPSEKKLEGRIGSCYVDFELKAILA